MESLVLEVKNFLAFSKYSSKYKEILKPRLDDFCIYLSKVTNTTMEEVHLERIYETVSPTGKTLFYERIDTKLIEQYFHEHLHKSYSWLQTSRRALSNFFYYLNRRYDFPILTEEMVFNIDDYKAKPTNRNKYIPSRHDLLKFLQTLLTESTNLERDALFFLLLISTGSRPSEILNTRISDIDYENEIIYRKLTKNKTSKYIVLREGFGEILRRYVIKFSLKNDDYLFCEDRKQIHLNLYQEVFASYLEKAKIPFTTLHKLRHAFATMMVENGAEILVIQQLLGHKKIQSTNHYIDPNYIRNFGMELEINKDIYKHISKENLRHEN